MRRRHAISPGFSGNYRDLGIPSRKRHASACKLILSVVCRRRFGPMFFVLREEELYDEKVEQVLSDALLLQPRLHLKPSVGVAEASAVVRPIRLVFLAKAME